MQEILERAASLEKLRQSKCELEQCFRKLNGQIESAEKQIIAAMVNSGIDGFRFADKTYTIKLVKEGGEVDG